MLNSFVIGNMTGTGLGIDIGSTTVKIVIIKNGKIVFECYERHQSQVRRKTVELLKKAEPLIKNEKFHMAMSGSAGLGLANQAKLPFIQEVFSTGELVKRVAPDTDVVIELGGEDAKVIFFRGITDERMNGSCAGGTGAFIDQMASLLSVSVDDLDKLSLNHTKIYPIASRCGVFAKTDIQPLINQGALKEDISASIYQAVVNQTISGLVQGYEVNGKVMFLGGPLYYCHGLRERFVKTLKLSDDKALFPEYGLIAVALGTAMYSIGHSKEFTFNELLKSIEDADLVDSISGLAPLFKNKEEYDEFTKRHNSSDVPYISPESYSGSAYLGIDCGSTTTKLVLISENDDILYTYYGSNKGNPIQIIKEKLTEIYDICKDKIKIKSSAVTGYGEELIQHAFGVDNGIVETMAHFMAAKHFNPKVDFILDIGGQDIKCFKIRNNSVDSIMLNEACSSGCGSFIETFAHLAGYEVEEFSKLGIFAKNPVDLGSRCTVFMNSSVKQAQKDGADVSDISAGLSMSVVKNAIYKVIRANSPEELGRQIVVQGGTFLNDAVLRSFEIELGCNVIRPKVAGLMGAYGAALYSKKSTKTTTLIGIDGIRNFKHAVKTMNCGGCENHCNLTINIFNDNAKFISGNKCDKGSGNPNINIDLPNIYQYKRDKFSSLAMDEGKAERGTVGMPLTLGMYDLAPFWHEIFRKLGYKVVFSEFSSRKTYIKGQHTIPSDTACYPAKLMHGHIEELLAKGVDFIFAPCLTYNFEEGKSDNHYNCPIVAYYPELLKANIKELNEKNFVMPYLNINNKGELAKELARELDISLKLVKTAVNAGYKAYEKWMDEISLQGEKALKYAKENNKDVLVLAGRPYHVDPEICHLIDKLAVSLGFVVVSEDSVCRLGEGKKVNVLNQWTYHSRLYKSAELVTRTPHCEMVQLVSFGCGIDAITTDEVRAILESHGKLYTQLKIDEINNLGAVKIRLRSLLAVMKERNE